MRKFKSVRQAQRFLGTHATVYTLFNLGRHLISANHCRKPRLGAFNEWSSAVPRFWTLVYTVLEKLTCRNLYNSYRLHSYLGCVSPNQYTTEMAKLKKAAKLYCKEILDLFRMRSNEQGEIMSLRNRFRFFRLNLGAACFLLLTILSSASFAGVIYEYREDGSPSVIGALEVASPPASASIGWSTAAPSDLIALFLDDAIFGLGSANLLFVGGTLNLPLILSLDGAKLDRGGIGIQFPTIFSAVPTDPTIDKRLSMFFDSSSGGDFIGLSTQSTFPDGSILIGDLFIYGNWVAQVPTPGTLMLLWIGLLGVGWSVNRRRDSRVLTT